MYRLASLKPYRNRFQYSTKKIGLQISFSAALAWKHYRVIKYPIRVWYDNASRLLWMEEFGLGSNAHIFVLLYVLTRNA